MFLINVPLNLFIMSNVCVKNEVKNDSDKQIIQELKEVMADKYFSYALELFSQLEDPYSKKSLLLKKQIYKGFFEETKKFILNKLKNRLKKFVKKKNLRLLDLELKIVEKNLEFLKNVIFQNDPNEKIARKFRSDIDLWKKLQNEFKQYQSIVRESIIDYWVKYEKLKEKIKQKLEKKHKKRRRKKAKNGILIQNLRIF